MFNILSHIGVNLQSELCLWALLGIIRTIFDATLFKVNSNLKQVWQMSMPPELSMPVQRAVRTIISGIMLLQCFSVYIYLASYIILLYPVFLEEKPSLLLPWLLMAAIRKLLCELTSLALGLGICLLLGPARTACVRFLVVKFFSITPAFYMWMLVFSYYNALKVMVKFQTPVGLDGADRDYGLELAVRRRRTKSLQGEHVLRRKLFASLSGENTSSDNSNLYMRPVTTVRATHSETTDPTEETKSELQNASLTAIPTERTRSDIGSYEDWFGSELAVPRSTDRILEQFVIMMLRIGVYMNTSGQDSDPTKFLNSRFSLHQFNSHLRCETHLTGTETPPLVGSHRGKVASYLENYPQIFNKKPSTTEGLILPAELLQEPPPERLISQTLLTENYPADVNLNESSNESQETIKTSSVKSVTLSRTTKEAVSDKKDEEYVMNIIKRNASTHISESYLDLFLNDRQGNRIEQDTVNKNKHSESTQMPIAVTPPGSIESRTSSESYDRLDSLQDIIDQLKSQN